MTEISDPILTDTLVEVEATFTAPNGSLVDPAQVIVIWKSPTEDLTTWTYGVDVELVRVSLGVYAAQKILDETGLWKVKWSGVGTAPEVTRIATIDPDF